MDWIPYAERGVRGWRLVGTDVVCSQWTPAHSPSVVHRVVTRDVLNHYIPTELYPDPWNIPVPLRTVEQVMRLGQAWHYWRDRT